VKEQRQTMDTVCAYVRQNLAAPDALLLGIWRTGSPTHCGTVRLHEIDPAGTRAVIGVCIFDRTAWGRGTGGKAVRAATTWALDHLGIAEVEAGVYGDNVSSQRAFSKAGYEWTRDISDLYTLDGRPALVRLYVARGSARKPRS
jgi:RimJ/RimL family protein N-acetyltransferase